MKRILFAFFLLSMLISCSKQGTTGDPITARINLVGDVSEVSYSAFSKSTSSEYCLLVNVYVYDSSIASYSKYASGIFDDLGKISIDLISGSTYKFCSSYVPTMVNRYGFEITNVFSYGSNIQNLYTGSYSVSLSYAEAHPQFERFYGENIFEVSPGSTNLPLELKRCSTRFNVNVSNLLVGSIKVVIEFEKGPSYATKCISLTLTQDNPEEDIVFSLMDATKCWNDDSYTENYDVFFYYIIGDSEQLISTKNIEFKRNASSNVTIKINNSLSPNGHYLPVSFDAGEYAFGSFDEIDFHL